MIFIYFRTFKAVPFYNRGFHTCVCVMGKYDAEFSQAKERLNALKEDPGNDVKLKIYALFKQVVHVSKDIVKLCLSRSSTSAKFY